MIIFYIYKIHFLCGFPSGRYYIGKHKHPNNLKTDNYVGSGDFCKAYFKKYGKQEGLTYIKEILEINPSEEINNQREELLIGDKYKTDPLCMNLIPGGSGILPNEKNSVVQYDMQGNIVKIHKTQSEAACFVGLKDSSGISKCCSTRKGSAGGYIWRFEGDEPPIITEGIHSMPIIQYNAKGIKLNVFSTIIEASKITGINVDSISACCTHKRKSGGGYIWRKINDPLTKNSIKTDKFWGKRKVEQYTLSDKYITTFNSIREAATSVNVSWQSIQRVCLGKRKTCKGYKWRYVNE